MIKQNVIVMILLCGLIVQNLFGGIGFAVAKDENNSVVQWFLAWNDSPQEGELESKARRELIKKGYENVYGLSGGKDIGRNLVSGYWVVVSAQITSSGVTRIYMGMGASSSSYAEAERRAVSNMKTYAWSYKESRHGYEVEDKGIF